MKFLQNCLKNVNISDRDFFKLEDLILPSTEEAKSSCLKSPEEVCKNQVNILLSLYYILLILSHFFRPPPVPLFPFPLFTIKPLDAGH